MSETPGGLQFESAEFQGAAAAASCATCAAPIRSTYYQVGSAIACERCRRQIEYDATHGSPLGRMVKAGLFGFVAAGIGAGIYYAVRALTGYEFGLIAVVVGLMVGGAVRAGSGNRGGIPYQLLAVFLTYAAIVGTYIPDIWKGIAEMSAKKETQAAAAAPAGELPAAASAPVAARATTAEAASVTAPAAPKAHAPLSFGMVVLALLGFAAIVFAAPFLMGFENAIGIVIIGIGLFEAWKINRKPDRTVTGPFRVADAGEAPVPAAS
jgi:hypothetical protein